MTIYDQLLQFQEEAQALTCSPLIQAVNLTTIQRLEADSGGDAYASEVCRRLKQLHGKKT